MTTTTPQSAKTPIPEQRELPCKLTEPELLARGEEMSQAELKIAELKERRKGINGEIADNRAERKRLADIIDAGEEKRMVSCTWHDDFEHNVFRCKRDDTGDEVATRTMTVDDRQLALEVDEVTGEVLDVDPANDNAAGPDDDSDDDSDDDEPGDNDTVTSLDAARKRKRSSAPARAAAKAKRPAKGGMGKAKGGGKRSKSTRHSH
jgi:hypothetical protein